MITTLLLSLIPIAAGGLLATLTSGGTILGVLDFPDFITVTLLFAVCMFLSGYGKTFCRIFSSKKKFQTLSLEELQKTETALSLAEKLLFYTALVIPLMFFITLLMCTPYGSIEMHSIGPNSAVLFLCAVYICLFEMMICTVKAKVRKTTILYMAETEEAVKESQKTSAKSVIKTIVGIVLIIAVIIFYNWTWSVFNYCGYNPITSVIDLPSIVIILIFTIPLIAISGNFMNLMKGIKTVFSNKKLNVAEKNLYLNAVKTTVTLNWYGAITSTLIGWIGMMNNLEQAAELFPNIAVSLISLFYAVVLNLLLLIVETRINKVSE